MEYLQGWVKWPWMRGTWHLMKTWSGSRKKNPKKQKQKTTPPKKPSLSWIELIFFFVFFRDNPVWSVTFIQEVLDKIERSLSKTPWLSHILQSSLCQLYGWNLGWLENGGALIKTEVYFGNMSQSKFKYIVTVTVLFIRGWRFGGTLLLAAPFWNGPALDCDLWEWVWSLEMVLMEKHRRSQRRKLGKSPSSIKSRLYLHPLISQEEVSFLLAQICTLLRFFYVSSSLLFWRLSSSIPLFSCRFNVLFLHGFFYSQLANFYICLCKNREGEQTMPPQSMPLWPKDCLEPVIFKKQQTLEKLWKPKGSCPFVREIYIYKGKFH